MTHEDFGHDHNDIAVIGMSCRLPGAPDINALWQLLVDEREGTTRRNLSAVREAGASRELASHPDFVPVGSSIGDIDGVDLAAFGLSKKEAEYLDPQHRVLTEEVWHALDDAGHGHGGDVSRVGVFLGCSPSEYLHHEIGADFQPSASSNPSESMQIALGTMPDYLATGIAYRLGLQGPAVTLLTACSSSLVAVHMAVESLRSGETDMAIAGGVTVRVPEDLGYVHVPDGPFSADGHTRSYGAGATGAVFTQGAGAVVLRKVADAKRECSRMYAVVRGSAVNNDGSDKSGFVVPGVAGHADVVAEAIADSGFTPRDMTYIEGHGTGTALGDPIEFAALRHAFGTADRPWCHLGSIKSNIGHTEAAAGIAGFIKAALCVHNGIIPASLHSRNPNPAIDEEGSAIAVADHTMTWDVPGPRVAGISSLGFGGTNAHVVIAQAEPDSHGPRQDSRTPTHSRGEELWLLGAATSASLDSLRRQAREAAAPGAFSGAYSAAARARVLAKSRGPRQHRAALVVDERAGAVDDVVEKRGRAARPRIVAACPGGGAQQLDMLTDLYSSDAEVRYRVDELSAIVVDEIGIDPRKVICPQAAKLDPGDPDAAAFGLPALFITSVAAGELMLRCGLHADAWIGHSSGEPAAAVLSGALEAEGALRFVARRAEALERIPAGSMLRIRREGTEVEALCRRFPGLEIAAQNSPSSTVVAGPEHVTRAVREELGADAIAVRISVPGHSSLVDAAVPAIREAANHLRVVDPHAEIFSCLLGRRAGARELAEPEYWAAHVAEAVRFRAAFSALCDDAAEPVTVVDLGPGQVVAALCRECEPGRIAGTIALAQERGRLSRASVLGALARLYCAGVDVELPGIESVPAAAAPLFRYHFDRQHAWYRRAERAREHATRCESGALETEAAGARQLLYRRTFRDRHAPAMPQDSAVIGINGSDEKVDTIILPAGVEEAFEALRAAATGASNAGRGLIAVYDDRAGGTGAATFSALGSIRAEYPGLVVGAIVVHAGEPAAAAGALAAEFAAGNAEKWSQIVHVRDGVWQDEVVTARPGYLGAEEQTSSENDDEFVPGLRVVVLGGRGAVGSEIASALARSGASVTVTSRRTDRRGEHPQEPGVIDVHWDGTNPQRLAEIIGNEDRYASTVVIQATGVVGADAFAPLAETDASVFADHRRARVGVWTALEEACRILGEAAPDVCVAMSSLASVHGGFGQSAYATACREVELNCENSTSTPRRLAIAWDGWRTEGADTGGFSRKLLQHSLDPNEAIAVLRELLRAPDRGTVIVTRRDPNYLAKKPESSSERSQENFRRDDARAHHTEASAAAPTDVATPGHADSGMSASRHIPAVVYHAWADALGLPVSDVDDTTDFFACGGQSLAATGMLAQIRESLGVDVRLRDLLDDPTPAGLCDAAGIDRHREADAGADDAAREQTSGDRREEEHAGAALESTAVALTPVQRAYLLGRESAYGIGSSACHSFVEFVAEQLDTESLEKAFRAVIARHPMLRAIVDVEGVHEVEISPEQFVLDVTDLRGDPHPETALERWREKLSVRTAPATRWPLVSPYVALTDSGAHTGWSIDVLVCDADSFGVLYDEVGIVYRGEELPPTPTPSFAHFAELVSHAQKRATDDEKWWRERVAGIAPAPQISGRAQDSANVAPAAGGGGFERRSIELSESLSRAVFDEAARRKVTPSALMLTAYGHMLSTWSGAADFSVMLTTFDRPVEMAGTVGDFTELSIVPMHMTGDLQADVSGVTESLFTVLDRAGVSGVDVLSMRSELDSARFGIPVVFTSTLGSESMPSLGQQWCGRLAGGISQTPQVYLDHQVFSWNGHIVAQWDFLGSAIDGAELDRGTDTYMQALRTLVGDCDETASVVDATCGDDDADSGTHEAEDTDELLDVIKDAWAKALGGRGEENGAAGVADDAHFLRSGGDSLAAMRVVTALRAEGIQVAVADILSGSTPRDLEQEVRAAGWHRRSVRSAEILRATEGEPFPLTPLQQAYWVGQSGGWELSNDAAHFVVDFFDPQCDGEKLRRAARRLIEHQPMLRAVVTADGQQRILPLDAPELAVDPVEVVDLRRETDAVIDREIAATRQQWQVAGPEPAHWPAFRIKAHLLPGGGARIHVAAALVFIDGWSFYLFFQQLLSYHDEPNAVFRAPSITFADYVLTRNAAMASPKAEEARQRWRQRIPNLPPPPPLPAADIPGRVAVMNRAGFRLSTQDADALTERCTQASITPTALFGAAYSRAISEWTSTDNFLLTMLYFNRMPVASDIDQVLGAFSSTVLVDIDLPPTGLLTECAQSFSHSVAASLQDDLVDGVDVVREMMRMGHRRALPSPVVFTSTLGFGDPAAQEVLQRIDPADVWERMRTPQVLLDMQVSGENGQIVCNVDYPEGAFEADIIDQLAARIHELVTAFCSGADTAPAETSAPWQTLRTHRPHRGGAGANAVSGVITTGGTSGDREDGVEPSAEVLDAVREAFAAQLGHSCGDDEDFLTLGGDSLGLMRLLASVRAATGAAVAPARAVAEPSIWAIARLAQAEITGGQLPGGRQLPDGSGSSTEGGSRDASAVPRLDPDKHLVPLSDGELPLYLIHPSGGDVLSYADLASELGGVSVVTLPDPEYLGTEMPTDLSLVTQSYADLIERAHGDSAKPLYFGGWSMGGTLAHEVAAKLAFRGRAIGGVIMIDSTTPDRIRAITGIDGGARDSEMILRYLRSVTAFAADTARGGAGEVAGLDAPLSLGECADAEQRLRAAEQVLATHGLPAVDLPRKLRVFTRHLEGLATHSAGTLVGAGVRVLLLRALRSSPVNSGIGMGVDDAAASADLGWGPALGDMAEIVDVDGHHYSLLSSPAVEEVAEAIGSFLNVKAVYR